MNILQKIIHHGLHQSLKIAAFHVSDAFANWRTRNAPKFNHPTEAESAKIELALRSIGVNIADYSPDTNAFLQFKSSRYFPDEYHGGIECTVWDEKLLEHWIAAELLKLDNYTSSDIYLDIAAGSSPWVFTLRTQRNVQAFAIDLSLEGSSYRHLPYYLIQNGTNMSFSDASVRGASLQCAFEMFMGNDDINLIKELSRILKPSGKAIILPLYMHTNYCAYSSPRYYGKGYCDPQAKEFICRDWSSIPSARYYDSSKLKERILDTIEELNMRYEILILRNKRDLGKNIYCNFILEITK